MSIEDEMGPNFLGHKIPRSRCTFIEIVKISLYCSVKLSESLATNPRRQKGTIIRFPIKKTVSISKNTK